MMRASKIRQRRMAKSPGEEEGASIGSMGTRNVIDLNVVLHSENEEGEREVRRTEGEEDDEDMDGKIYT